MEPGFTTLDNDDLLALTTDSLDLLGELSGSFTLSLDGLTSEVVPVGDEIALVNFTGGTLTVTADVERLKAALAKVEPVAEAQLTATLTKYGLPPTKAIDLNPPSGWQDDLLNQVKTSLPYTVNLADCAAGRASGRYGDRVEMASICAAIGQVVVVNVWGAWCPECRAEAPSLVQAESELPDDARSPVSDPDVDPKRPYRSRYHREPESGAVPESDGDRPGIAAMRGATAAGY